MRPALARGNPALGIEIKENVVFAAPALTDEPVSERNRPIIVLARMADEKP